MRWSSLAVSLVVACSSSAAPAPRHPRAPAPIANTAAPIAPAGAASGATPDTLGTAHPIVLEAVADDGGWAVICQARADTDGDGEVAVHVGYHGDTWGDRFVPYLVERGGRETEVDAVAGQSRDGRWLAVVRGGALALRDGATGAWVDLPGADATDDGVPVLGHRAVSIDPGGTRLTYFRKGDRIVIRELATGAEREVVQPGIWRVEVDADGRWARLVIVAKDTDGDGKVTWPSLRTSLSDRNCRGPITSYSTGGWDGDRPTFAWLDLATGTVAGNADEVIAPVGDALLRVDARGALVLGARTLAPPACAAQVVGVSGDPARVLYTCAGGAAPAPVQLAGPGVAQATKAVAERDGDWRDHVARFRDPVACLDGTCVTLADGISRPDPSAGGDVLARAGTRRLVSGPRVAIVDVADGSRVELDANDGALQAQAGPVVVVGTAVYDLERKVRIGAVAGLAQAVDRAGRVLVLAGADGDIPTGPLRWITPVP